ncbi:MAG: FKBP-type peptidyl-prolyl cis-trans isomerase [Promethearchaeota archaeon]
MGKSKYQIKATTKVETHQSNPKSSRKPKYYDEEFLKSNKNKKNTGFALFTIATLLIAGGIVIGIQVNDNRIQQLSEDTLAPSAYYDPTNFDSDDPTPTSGIQNGDSVTLEYTLWVDFDGDGNVNTASESPYQGPAEFDTEMLKSNLIAGFYYECLGMEVGEEKTFEIPGQLDANQDGIEDNTNNELLGYGPSNAELYNTLLVFRVRVISIN